MFLTIRAVLIEAEQITRYEITFIRNRSKKRNAADDLF